ncbi:Downstream target of A 2 [Hibiscus syriacus]|uniref:Downstream target of A 2 n=1 Tax=Hibiscus syriacus TaxID=106335 RepID=A0A6A3A7I7_HIBSY|nr:Downstream target of A 2 [Hibiscus syriacus]
MEEPVKIFHGVWPCGDEVIHGCFYKLGIGRLKGFVTTTATFIFFFFLVVVVALFWMDIPIIRGDPFSFTSKVHHERFQFPLTCSTSVNISSAFNPKDSPTKTCPDYFRWIHQDLKQFKTSGITKDLIESGTPSADFRLVIVDGNAYVDRHLKFAVDWGNNHTHEAQAIGKAGSKFIEEMVSIRNVYDYMSHLLSEYSKLLKYKPTIPPNAQRVCAETTVQGLAKEFMLQSMVKSPSDELPCALPPHMNLKTFKLPI